MSMAGCHNDIELTEPTETLTPIVTEPQIIDNCNFIYNWDDLTEEWWDSPSTTNCDITNRELFQRNSGHSLGNVSGKLSLPPTDLDMPLMVNGKIYLLKFKNNDCFIPQEIKAINDKVGTKESMLYVSAITETLFPYMLNLRIANIPKNINMELPVGEWSLIKNEEGDKAAFGVYYPIDKEYCLTTSWSKYYVPKESENDLDQDDIEALMRELMLIVSVEKVSNAAISGSVKIEDIELDSKLTVKISDIKIAGWHFGSTDIVNQEERANSCITAYNAKNKSIDITEYSKERNLGMYFMQQKIDLVEYLYSGRQIYLCKYSNSADETLQGKYVGIVFEADSQWYRVNYTKNTPTEVEDIDRWIKDMIDGVLFFG
jgi:hypothetical protein